LAVGGFVSVPENRLLAWLSPADFNLLEPHLEPIELKLRQKLEQPNRRIEYAYFPEQGFASVVAPQPAEKSMEVGLIGREGMTGLAVVLDDTRSPLDVFIQAAGRGRRISVPALQSAMQTSPSLAKSLRRYAHCFLIQASYAALINGRYKLEERLARWLLMAQDRLRGEELSLTHEFLALMLGVRRAGVTIALNLLQKRGFIRHGRGRITILDRAGLVRASNQSYGRPEAELERLFAGRQAD
jgi:CRP-like cAMP-binding protein